ncbi:hypothetical protein GYB22_01375 [bacterium]|nr:hypothetical protein [bacterium]
MSFIRLIFFISAYFLINASLAQTHFVYDQDTNYLHRDKSGQWTFKPGLEDGRWVSLHSANDTSHKSVIAYIKNGKKEGVERKYLILSRELFSEIHWRNGLKHGKETLWNSRKILHAIIHYQHGVMHGYTEVRDYEGDIKYHGYFKHGVKDSFWTHYEHSRMDTNYLQYDQPIKRYRLKYVNGQALMWDYWDDEGNALVENGNGTSRNRNYDIESKSYKNGLADGVWTTSYFDHTLKSRRTYEEGCLTQKIVFSPNGDTSTFFNYHCTGKSWKDTTYALLQHVHMDYFIDEDVHYDKLYDSTCFKKYNNGNYKFKGEYNKDQKIGIWKWYYPSGEGKIQANFDSNEWEHFDSLGNKLETNFKGEYITQLTSRRWFMNDSIGMDTVLLSNQNKHMITPLLEFGHDGTLKVILYLECGKNTHEVESTWQINGDIITLIYPDPWVFEEQKHETKTFRIHSTEEQKIVLISIDE